MTPSSITPPSPTKQDSGKSPIIDVRHISKGWGGRTVLNDISFQAEEGTLLSILGPNGAGKTTTLRILTGQIIPDSGTVFLAGIPTAQDPVRAKALCGVASQHLNLDPELTVFQNLDIHGRFFHMSKAARMEASERLLHVTGLEEKAHAPARTLSGGQKRRVLLARALMHNPRILFLDEPTAGLDPGIRRTLWDLIRKIRAQGTTILLTTHYIEEAESLADKVLFIEHGTITAEGTPQELTATLGTWAVDTGGADDAAVTCFASREEAARHAAHLFESGARLRPVCLEDVYRKLTGKSHAGKPATEEQS